MKILKISSPRTKRISVRGKKNFKEAVKIAVKSIKQGEVMICPTDTVYGLLADAQNKNAIKKLFEIKKRPKEKAIPIFVKDIKTAKRLAYINGSQEKFLKKFWPGRITVVLKNKEKLPKILFGPTKKIGLRIPNYKLVNLLLKKLNRPLTGTSANISGKFPSTKIKEVIKQFKNQPLTTSRGKGLDQAKRTKSGGGQPDLILDAGNLLKSKPSTVIDLTTPKPKILRVGPLTKKQLEKFLIFNF